MKSKYLFLFLSVSSVVHGKNLTLKQALEATYNTPRLQAKREETKAKHETYVQARSGFLPTLTAIGTHKQSSGKSSFEGTRSSTMRTDDSASLTLKQNIFKGGSTYAEVEKATADIKKSWADLEKEQLDAFSEAADAYFELMAAKKYIEVSEKNVTFLGQAYESANEKYKVGEETQTNASAAEADLLSGRADLESVKADLENARGVFLFKTGITSNSDLDRPQDIDFLPKTLDVAYGIAQDHNPTLKAARYGVEFAQADADRVSGALLPTVDLNIEASRSRGRDKIGSRDFLNRQQGVGDTFSTPFAVTTQVSLPLYEGGSTRSQIRQALKGVTTSRVTVEKLKAEIKQTVGGYYVKVVALKNTHEAYKKVVAASQMALNSLMEEQKAGSKTLLDVLKQQKEHFERQKKLVDTEKEYLKNLYKLMALLGMLTPEKLKLNVERFDPTRDFDQVKGYF